MRDLKTRLEKAFKRVDIPKPESLQPFEEYINTLTQWNRSIALISKREENIVNHLVAPSLLFFKVFKKDNLKIIDIGSGAGFPAVILKIYKPTLSITMIEPNHKKTAFLRYICSKLNLKCSIIDKRLEEIDEELICDVITARAINLRNMIDEIKKIRAGHLFYLTSKDNQLDFDLKQEILFKNHCAKIYTL
ncbi:16S rRNA (guanine(527)-N(7))-methyltransferase RsmG [Hippea alviniae]|uniref:16S rRNA (guanine(527)-N(7))-methyltransferase RsmG n=1 Tax=Hippea alviniae TaxID=1279027 RepID=UPI0003B6DDAB|nr:16S rRNA (guanine(527)-N(7))-methyltransferase RsmG [Hippea alviniae]